MLIEITVWKTAGMCSTIYTCTRKTNEFSTTKISVDYKTVIQNDIRFTLSLMWGTSNSENSPWNNEMGVKLELKKYSKNKAWTKYLSKVNWGNCRKVNSWILCNCFIHYIICNYIYIYFIFDCEKNNWLQIEERIWFLHMFA